MTKKRLLLLNPPSKELIVRDYYCTFTSRSNYLWLPQDLLILSGILKHKFELKIIDAIAENLSFNQTLNLIKQFSPHIIILTTGSASIDSDLKLAKSIFNNFKPDIYLSGSITIFKKDYFFNNFNFIKGIICDFTDNTISDALLNNEKSNSILTEKNQSLPEPPPYFAYPVPLHNLFPLDNYNIYIAKNHPFTVVITSIGCPFNCGFCVAGQFPYRFRLIDNFFEELEFIKKLNIKEILFQDPTFIVNKTRTLKILEGIKKIHPDLNFMANARIELLDREIIEHLSQSGCHSLHFGLEHIVPDVLDKYKKTPSLDEVKYIVNLCHKNNITVLGYFIIGFPEDSEQTVLKTIDFAIKSGVDFASFSILTPDIGTPLRNQLIQAGLIENNTLQFDPSVNAIFPTKYLTPNQIYKLRNLAMRKFYLRLPIIFNQIKFLSNRNNFLELLNQFKAFLKNYLLKI